MRIRVRHGRIPEDGRTIMFSDVHAHDNALEEILRLVNPTSGDVLFPVGDYLERGTDGLAVLRRLMKLCREYEVYPTMGNVDSYVLWMLGKSTKYADRALRFALATGKGRFAGQARELLGETDPFLFPENVTDTATKIDPTEYFSKNTENSREEAAAFDAFRARVWEAFGEELTWLRRLPAIIDAGSFVFVHGGLPLETAGFTEEPSEPCEMTENEPERCEKWAEMSPTYERLAALQGRDVFEVLKDDHFMDQGLGFDRWVVCGHWPVTNYRAHIPSCMPFIDPHRHIIGLDGGCGIKADGQLNALIFGSDGSEFPRESRNLTRMPEILGRPVTTVYSDELPRAMALESQEAAPEDPISIRWGDNEVRVLEYREDSVYVEHLSSGKRMWAPKDFIYLDGDPAHLGGMTDYRLGIEPGDPVRIIRKTVMGTLVKRGGVTGWYMGKLKENEEDLT